MMSSGVTASLLDRIFWDDDDPRITPGRVTEAVYIASAVRDLQDLLNSRNVLRNVTPSESESVTERVVAETPPQAKRLADTSVIMAGVPDFSSLNLTRSADRDRLAYEIAYAISSFDRRFTDVRVQPTDSGARSGSLPFVIHARLRIGASFATIGLEGQYESSNMLFTVKRPGGNHRLGTSGFVSGGRV